MTSSHPQLPLDPLCAFEEQAVHATVWTSVLLHARMVGDFDEAARARRELDALGVSVRFRRHSRAQSRLERKEAHDAGGGSTEGGCAVKSTPRSRTLGTLPIQREGNR